MPEDNPTTATSEGTSNPADAGTGGSADGGAGGTDAVEKLTAERDALQAEARRHQAERDRAKAELDKIKADLAKANGASSEETPASGLTAEQVRMEMRREMARTRELNDAVATARSQYPNALGDVFSRLDEYDSPEELLEAARASHEALSSHLDAQMAQKEKELRERYEKVHGPLPETSTSPDAPAPKGDPTVDELSDMTVSQLDALEAKEPGIIDRIIRSADQLTNV